MKYLYDIAIMRPIIILLVMIYHSFAMYAGVWAAPDGLQEVHLYLWICKFAQGFHIEGMAFIAGYVFAFQSITLNRKLNFTAFATKKAKRLFVPCIIFGMLYYFLFLFHIENFDLLTFLTQIISGVAHLWFLPMLFWCFIGLWVIEHLKLSTWWMLIVLAFISILPTPTILGGLTYVPHFLFYSYLGYWIYARRDIVFSHITSPYIAICMWLIYIILCIFDIRYIMPLQEVPSPDIMSKLMVYVEGGIIKLGIASSGIIALLSTIEQSISVISEKGKHIAMKSSDISFGVYLCHQFILIALYRHTNLLTHVGSYWLPWVGLLISLIVSICITHIALKTKVGRFLMQ